MATGDSLTQGYLSLKRQSCSTWYDSIPSNGEVRVYENETNFDVKLLQEKVTTEKHNNWNSDRDYFLIKADNISPNASNQINAYYSDQDSVSISWTEPVKVYLKDPWYVSNQETLEQPETYREIDSDVSYSIFLREGGESPSSLQYPYYSVKASRFYATTDSIYVFSHWSSPNSKATFDPNNVNNYAGCGVRFDQNDAIIKPNYKAINDSVDYLFTVQSDESLEIPEGANIRLANGFKIKVEGSLELLGTVDDTIKLSSSNQWNGIEICNPSLEVDIDYCVIKDASCALKFNYSSIPSVELENSLEHIEFASADTCIKVLGGGLTNRPDFIIRNSIFDGGVAVDMVNISLSPPYMYQSDFIIEDCEFTNCSKAVNIADNAYSVDVKDCQFVGNTEAIYIDSDQLSQIQYIVNREIHDNLFTDNYDGIYIDKLQLSGDCLIYNNTFDDNAFGLFRTYNGDDVDANIRNNIFSNSSYYGMYVESTDLFDYNCFWNNNTNSNETIGEHSITQNPKYIDVNNDNFYLQNLSPCIDTGDPSSDNDPDETCADMGAYYYPQTTFSGTIDSDTTWYGKITITGNVTIASGAKLTIYPYTEVKFDDNKSLTVYGILQADGGEDKTITFTSSNDALAKGNWANIRFNNSSIDDSCYIKNCNIEYSYYGIYCYYAEPTIENNTITHNTYGIRLNYSSPSDIETNYFEDNTYGIYGYHSSAHITDNYFLDNTRGIYFYYGTPVFYSNTYETNSYGAYFAHADPEFGPTVGTGKGLNVLKQNTTGLRAYDSDPFLGSSDGYNTRIGGYNEIHTNSSYNVYAQSSSDVDAQWCWWGASPPNTSKLYSDATSLINYNNYLGSATGGGSSLAKIAGSFVEPTGKVNLTYLAAGFDPKKPNPNKLSDLWLWAHDLRINDKNKDAVEVYRKLIRKFSADSLAGKALRKIYFLYRKTGQEGFDVYLNSLLANPKISENLYPAIYSLLLSCSLDNCDIENALKTGEKILDLFPDTEEEKMALFNLVIACANEKEYIETASKYLEIMRVKYPDDELTLMAREAMGEKINWALMKPIIEPKPQSPAIPDKYALHHNYPNPFNPMTTIAYDLPEDTKVTLVVYDILGREVIRLVDSNKQAGFHRAIWNGINNQGQPVSSGVYLYRIKAGEFVHTNKMIFMR